MARLPAATERLFFALRPDARTAQRIEALAQCIRGAHGLRGRTLGPARFHVTLHLVGDFVGPIPAEVLDGTLAAARPVAARRAPFAIGFDTVASFTRKRRNMPLVLLDQAGRHDAGALQHDLIAAFIGVGLAQAPAQPFTPHLTLLYDDIPVAPSPIEPLAWQADALFAMRSVLGQSRHEVLARLPLGG